MIDSSPPAARPHRPEYFCLLGARLLAGISLFWVLALPLAGAVTAKECVVLLHGLGRTHWSMLRLQLNLEDSGYHVWNKSYPSTKRPIEELSRVVGDAAEDCRMNRAGVIHFVTHSLGGILLRDYLQNHVIAEARRVIMLGPPNRGSEVVDEYRNNWLFQQFTGPAGQQLGTDPKSMPNRLPPISLEVGIIAGKDSSDPWFSGLFTEDNDGKVSVSRAKLPEMKDFLVVDSGHTFIMNSSEVVRQVKAFLRTGRFERKPR